MLGMGEANSPMLYFPVAVLSQSPTADFLSGTDSYPEEQDFQEHLKAVPNAVNAKGMTKPRPGPRPDLCSAPSWCIALSPFLPSQSSFFLMSTLPLDILEQVDADSAQPCFPLGKPE